MRRFGWFVVFLAVLAAIVLAEMWCKLPHRTEDVGYGVQVQVYTICSFLHDGPGTGGKNQFWGANDYGAGGSPRFLLLNTAQEPRDVDVRSMAAWNTPLEGVVHLEPGQTFEFRIESDAVWYVWIEPRDPKKRAP